MKTFYTYLWLRENGVPYYVGKGTGRRAFRKKSPPIDRILVQEFPCEEDALSAEVFLISYYGRKEAGGTLINISPGGDKPPLQTHGNSGSFKKGVPHPKKGTGMSLEDKRKKHNLVNEKYRRKQGIKTWEEQQKFLKINPPHKGKKHSQESIEKIRLAAQRPRGPREPSK